MVKKISEESVDSGESYYCKFYTLAVVSLSRIHYYEIKPLSDSNGYKPAICVVA